MVFFFSSRRRHTRWTGDWSSDVCSSDLKDRGSIAHAGGTVGIRGIGPRTFRSEERRVGKECRSRWSPYHSKKKKRKKKKTTTHQICTRDEERSIRTWLL